MRTRSAMQPSAKLPLHRKRDGAYRRGMRLIQIQTPFALQAERQWRRRVVDSGFFARCDGSASCIAYDATAELQVQVVAWGRSKKSNTHVRSCQGARETGLAENTMETLSRVPSLSAISQVDEK